jgi:hypothetical protein
MCVCGHAIEDHVDRAFGLCCSPEPMIVDRIPITPGMYRTLAREAECGCMGYREKAT